MQMGKDHKPRHHRTQVVLPEELDKSVTVLDIPLPTREEVERLLNVPCSAQNIDLQQQLHERFVRGSLGLTERNQASVQPDPDFGQHLRKPICHCRSKKNAV